MTNVFCSNCMTDVDIRVEARHQILTVRGDEIEVPARVAVCATCNEDVWVNELEDETLAAAYSLYRQRHGLLTPEEITRIRKTWGLGQRAFALLLGWGEITLHRYESGSIQDAAHDAQLLMAEHANNIHILLDSNGSRLTPRQRKTVEQRLAEVHTSTYEADCSDESLERLLVKESAGTYGGNTPLSLTKTREMIVLFSEGSDMFVTKLAKLMFYSDFLHHKEHTVSITGLGYAHLTHGPVPEHYERIRADVLENSLVRVEERTGDGWAGEVLVACRPSRLEVFAANELRVIEYVRETLGSMTSKDVSDMSHAEEAYSSTSVGRPISYDMARSLSLTLPAPPPETPPRTA